MRSYLLWPHQTVFAYTIAAARKMGMAHFLTSIDDSLLICGGSVKQVLTLLLDKVEPYCLKADPWKRVLKSEDYWLKVIWHEWHSEDIWKADQWRPLDQKYIYTNSTFIEVRCTESSRNCYGGSILKHIQVQHNVLKKSAKKRVQ